MLLCSGAVKIMRIVYPIHFRLTPPPLLRALELKGKADTVLGGAIFSNASFFSLSIFLMEFF